jgi:hypothetical protein
MCVACPSAPRPERPVVETSHQGVFALVARGDTTVIDEYVRTDSALDGVVQLRAAGAKLGWARYHVEFSSSGVAIRSTLALGRVGTSPDSAPVGRFTITFGPDSIVEEWPNKPPTRVPYVAGTLPLFGPSIAMLQEVLFRAATLSGAKGKVEVPIYSVLSDGRVSTVSVEWIAPDTASFAIGNGRRATYVVRDGRLVSGHSGDLEFVTVLRSASEGAAFESAALRVVAFLKGQLSFDSIAIADSVTLYVSPEGGGGRTTRTRAQLRDRSAWSIPSVGRSFSLVPPAQLSVVTTRAGRHFNCREYSLVSRFPHLAEQPHVGVKLEPPGAGSCLQTWNATFVFDDHTPPRLVAVVYDQWEW